MAAAEIQISNDGNFVYVSNCDLSTEHRSRFSLLFLLLLSDRPLVETLSLIFPSRNSPFNLLSPFPSSLSLISSFSFSEILFCFFLD